MPKTINLKWLPDDTVFKIGDQLPTIDFIDKSHCLVRFSAADFVGIFRVLNIFLTFLIMFFILSAVGAISLLFEGIRVLRVWMRKHLTVVPLFSIIPENLGDTNDPTTTVPVNASYIINSQ